MWAAEHRAASLRAYASAAAAAGQPHHVAMKVTESLVKTITEAEEAPTFAADALLAFELPDDDVMT